MPGVLRGIMLAHKKVNFTLKKKIQTSLKCPKKYQITQLPSKQPSTCFKGKNKNPAINNVIQYPASNLKLLDT